MKRKPWPLPKLMEASRNAMTVYAALRWLAGDKSQWNTTRKSISAVCGLRDHERISTAMQALNNAGWIRLAYGRKDNRMWYRITFPVAGFFPVAGNSRYRDGRGRLEKPLRGIVPCSREKPLHSRKGVGGAPALASGEPAPPPVEEHHAARIERERMAAIRAARTASAREDSEVS